MRSVTASVLALCLGGVVAAADLHDRRPEDAAGPDPAPRDRSARLSPAPPPAAPAPEPPGGESRPAGRSPVTVVFERTAAWEGGYAARVRIANAGTRPISGWCLEFDLPDRIEAVRNARLRPGTGPHRVIVPGPATATIEPGGSVTLGLRVRGKAVAPTGCLLNGVPCPVDIGTALSDAAEGEGTAGRAAATARRGARDTAGRIAPPVRPLRTGG